MTRQSNRMSRSLGPSDCQQHDRAHETKDRGANPVRKSVKELGPGHHSKIRILLSDILHSPAFDYGMGLIILVNFGFVIVESDFLANDADKALPSWLNVSSWTVLCLFLLELIIRLYVYKSKFWHDGWNLFDFFVVVSDTCFSLLGLVFGSLFPVSALRILRLGKLARVSKVFRVFPELRIMMAGLIGSMKAIFWGMVLLIFCLLVWAVIAVQFIHQVNIRVAGTGVYERQNCERCPHAFSSVAEAVLTLCQQIVAGDSWGQITLPIIAESGITVLFFTGAFVTVGMAVLNLILGVVVQIAMQAHDSLKVEMEDEKLVERMEAHSHLLKLCSDLDTHGTGSLTKDEIFAGYDDSIGFRQTLTDMDIEKEDMEILWTILDEEKTGSVCYNSFVSRCYGLKLSNTQFMLAYIKFYITQIRHHISSQMGDLKRELDAIEEEIEDEAEILEKEERCLEETQKIIRQDMEDIKEAKLDEEVVLHNGAAAGQGAGQASAEAAKKHGSAKMIAGNSEQAELLQGILELRSRMDALLQKGLVGLPQIEPTQSFSEQDSKSVIMKLCQELPSATVIKLADGNAVVWV